MLQNMQKKVEAEGEREQELFEKYMCYCKTSGGDLGKSISDAGPKMDGLAADKKEAAAYAKESSEDNANLAATAKATTAIEQGMGSAFLQTPSASVVLRIAQKRQEEDLVSFLSGTQGYAPASGEIVGILKTMHDEMSADIAEEKAAEEAAIKAYDELMAAKTKEVNALTKAIEDKMTRAGELAVKIVQMKNDLGDTEA